MCPNWVFEDSFFVAFGADFDVSRIYLIGFVKSIKNGTKNPKIFLFDILVSQKSKFVFFDLMGFICPLILICWWCWWWVSR